MIAEFILTVRLTPETKEEALGQIAPAYRQLRTIVEEQVAKGEPIQIPPGADIRWVLITRRFE